MAMNRAEMRRRIQVNRRDPGPIKHAIEEYDNALNEALSWVPEALWYPEVDGTLVTVSEQRRYALATLTGLTDRGQVRRVWLEGSDDHYYEIGRWDIEDDAGTLTLVLDEDPPDEDLYIKVEYYRPHAQLAADDVDSTMDEHWLIAMTTILLLFETGSQFDDINQVQSDVTRFDAKKQAREKELLGRLKATSVKARTQAW